MGLILLYLGILSFAYLLGSKLRALADKITFLENLLMPAVYILVLVMGLRMGINEQVTSNLGSLGFQALILTAFCCSGSVIFISLTRRALKIDFYGNYANHHDKETHTKSLNDINSAKASDLYGTFVILGCVLLGMVIGHFVIAKHFAYILPVFNEVSGNFLTLFLCVLLFIIGFDMGLSDKIIKMLKGHSFAIVLFPIAAILGSLSLGTIGAALFGFSIKEGLSISAGFGWYTYAPTIITESGAEFAEAGAVAFMHNVIREVSGIILIPLLAKRIGYIEVCGLTGVASMDVCLPIVEHSCKEDIVVYSFVIGLSMNIASSVLVPVFMSLP